MRAIANGEDPRADQRSHVFLMAVLSTGTKSCPVRVRNLSIHGALLEGSNLPSERQSVSLKRGSLAMRGEIAWAEGQHCGMRFAEAINVTEWVDRAGPVGQQRIDAEVADFRHGTARKLPRQEPPAQSNSEELLEISARLFQTCERIAELPGMSLELAEEILKIEAAAHALQNVSRQGR